MVARAGAGAHQAVPYKRLTVNALAEGIMQCLSPEAKAGADRLRQISRKKEMVLRTRSSHFTAIYL